MSCLDFSAFLSIVVTTYNRPAALQLVLQALAGQTDLRFEVIVADDGSTAETYDLLQNMRLPYPLRHVWQSDEGFRAAMARNRATAVARGDYVIFLDGDCIPLPTFVAQHRQLAEKGWFVAGNRLLLSPRFTTEVITAQLPIWTWQLWQWWRAYRRGDVNRFFALYTLPLAHLRKWQPYRWQGAKTCNLAVWRRDLVAINGFDEDFHGWGHEDADLVARLQRYGVWRKEGRFAVPVLHLWHPEQNRQQESVNRQRLAGVLKSRSFWIEKGLNQYAK